MVQNETTSPAFTRGGGAVSSAEKLADWIDGELAAIKAAYPGGSSKRTRAYRELCEEISGQLRHLYGPDPLWERHDAEVTNPLCPECGKQTFVGPCANDHRIMRRCGYCRAAREVEE